MAEGKLYKFISKVLLIGGPTADEEVQIPSFSLYLETDNLLLVYAPKLSIITAPRNFRGYAGYSVYANNDALRYYTDLRNALKSEPKIVHVKPDIVDWIRAVEMANKVPDLSDLLS